MSYTPLEKPPQISPIFKADKVTLHISREKDGKLRLAYAGWDDTRSFRRTAAGKLAGGGKGGSYPPAGGSDDPPFKN